MSLKKYKIPKETVSLGKGQKLTVRGLGADHIVLLVRGQGEVMRDLFARAIDGKVTAADTEDLVVVLLDEAPILLGLVIAYACDEPDEWKTCMDMPFSDQVLLIDSIISLTFASEGGAKKVMEIIMRAIRAATKLTEQAA